MSFASASPAAPGKQNRPWLGLRGSAEVPKASPLDGVRRFASRPVMQATSGGLGGLPMLKAAQGPLFYAFCCFPPASPALVLPRLWRQGRGSKNGPEGPSLSL